MIIPESDYLEHYGKKGMRWGHRKGGKPGFGDTVTFRGRTSVRYNRKQTRAARNGKRVASFMLGGPIGLVAYNALSAPLKPGSGSKKKQSGAAFTAKLVATGVLATPLTAVAYAQAAAPIRRK